MEKKKIIIKTWKKLSLEYYMVVRIYDRFRLKKNHCRIINTTEAKNNTPFLFFK